MIASSQTTNTETNTCIHSCSNFKLLRRKVLFINRKDIGMWNFQDTFETHKQSFTSAFSVCMTIP